jgi:hypothetical protein
VSIFFVVELSFGPWVWILRRGEMKRYIAIIIKVIVSSYDGTLENRSSGYVTVICYSARHSGCPLTEQLEVSIP